MNEKNMILIMNGGKKMNGDKKSKTNFTAVEITQANLFCAVAACPSVFETDRGTFVLIGEKVNPKDAPEKIKNKIGAGEAAIEIPKGLITELFSEE
jgi:hypothetical protein